MPVTSRKPYPGETVFGGGAGVLFLGRGSKPSPEARTPKSPSSSETSSPAEPTRAPRLSDEQINRGLQSLRSRGIEIEADDPMLYAAAAMELSLLELAEKSGAQSTTEKSQD